MINRMIAFYILSILIGSSLLVNGQEDANPADLPLLPDNRHIGTMFYGGAAPPSEDIQTRIDEATDLGMNAFTVYLDWTALEPDAGVYNFSELLATLEWASMNGLSTFANLTVIDIEELVLPPEFLDSDGRELNTGISFNHPELVSRFLFLMDELVPILLEYDVFYLGVGNEVDGWLNEHPDQLNDYLAFIDTVRNHVQARNPELAIGITTTGGVPVNDPNLLDTFYTVSDVVSANIYGIDVTDFTIADHDENIDQLERFLAPFGDRPVVIPELGCNSAESMNSDLDLQAQCFETMFNLLDEYPNVRFVTVFTFHDFEPSVCEAIQAVFGYYPDIAIESIYEQRVADYLCTLGVVNANGSPKPAFDAFLRGIENLTRHK